MALVCLLCGSGKLYLTDGHDAAVMTAIRAIQSPRRWRILGCGTCNASCVLPVPNADGDIVLVGGPGRRQAVLAA